MKHHIYINQRFLIENKLNLDIKDMAVFDCLVFLSGSPSFVKFKEIEGERYFLCTWKFIILQLPCLKITSRGAVFNILKNLKEAGLLISAPNNEVTKMPYYRFGTVYDKCFSSDIVQNPALYRLSQSKNLNPIVQNPEPYIVQNSVPYKEEFNTEDIDKGKERYVWIEERKKDLFTQLLKLKEKNPDEYPKKMFYEFANWWTETDRKTQLMRMESQNYFEVKRRLKTWFLKKSDAQVIELWEGDEEIDLEALLNTLL